MDDHQLKNKPPTAGVNMGIEMTTNTQLWLDPDSMTYKPVVIDTNYLPFRVYEGKIYDSPHIVIVTNPAWSMDPQVFELTNYTLPYYPPIPVYIQPQPPQIIYVTNTVVVDKSEGLTKLYDSTGTAITFLAAGLFLALMGWGIGKATMNSTTQ